MNRLLAATVVILALAAGTRTRTEPHQSVIGIDHVILAVSDLDRAADRYRHLGFSLKPGRPHQNSIRNKHVKFPDGSEIELLTATKPRDDLAKGYLRYLRNGEGPAYVGLYAPSLDQLEAVLTSAGQPYRRDRLLLPKAAGLDHLFFGQRTRAPSDMPEHFAHANGAETLSAVWLAGQDFAAEKSLLASLGLANTTAGQLPLSKPVVTHDVHLQEARLRLLPAVMQTRVDRRIVGMTVKTRDLQLVRNSLAASRLPVPATVAYEDGRSMFLAPTLTHGIWIEFHERTAARQGTARSREKAKMISRIRHDWTTLSNADK